MKTTGILIELSVKIIYTRYSAHKARGIRMKSILHCDLNNFFASVECVDYPELKNVPMAVCGSIEDRGGIVLAKNELAKKMGVKTAEVIWQAKRKCPDLVCVKPHMSKYMEMSKKVFDIYCEYTDLVEPFGIDECWLDVTGSTLLFGKAEDIAFKIKEQIKSQLGLTISVGVSFTKTFAKLGSDIKKPDAITIITPENYKQVVWSLAANDMIGIGSSTYKKLTKYGICTIGDVANSDKDFLISILGKSGEAIWYSSNGILSGTVAHQDAHTVAKSIGNSTTTKVDLQSEEEVWQTMYFLAENVSTRLREQSLLATGVQISVKNSNLITKEFQAPLEQFTRHPKVLADLGFNLFRKNYSWGLNVRAVGIRAINLVMDDEAIQLNIMASHEKFDELETLENNVFTLRKRFGKTSVTRASLMNNANKTVEKNPTE